MVVLLRGGVEVARWPLSCDGRPDLAVVDELARLQLTAKRLGCSVRLAGQCADLVGLLELTGLGEVLEVVREAEGSEQVRVEEVVVPDDTVA